MNQLAFRRAFVAAVVLALLVASVAQANPKGRVAPIRELATDGRTLIPVPTTRGIATFIELEAGERIKFAGSGQSANCERPDDAWCISAPVDTNVAFVKPRTRASDLNVLHIVTDRRAYSFELTVVEPGAKVLPVPRLIIRGPAAVNAPERTASKTLGAAPHPAVVIPTISEAEIIAARLRQVPEVMNSEYSLSVAPGSEDIRPSMVYDDGRFTYLKFSGNREVPAVFHRDGNGEESIVNARMEGDFLVADRVSRRMVLRLGNLAVGIYNDAFDIEGQPAEKSTTVKGVERVLR